MKKYFSFLILVVAAMLWGCGNNSCNNTTRASELITKVYPESICEQIQSRVSVGGLHIDGLREIVDVECLRKTRTGYYAVLKLDNQKFAYIIIDENDMCGSVYQFQESFFTRTELEEILENATYFHEVNAYSPNVMYVGISCARVSVYPVQEGYIVATFLYDPPDAEDHVLKSVEFYTDITDSPVWGDPGIFQILDVDRGNVIPSEEPLVDPK